MVKKYATQMTRRGPVQVAFDEQSVETAKPQKRRPPPHVPMPALLADPEDEDVLQAEPEEDVESQITMIDESEDESVEPVVDNERLQAIEAALERLGKDMDGIRSCLLYTSPSPRDQRGSRMPSSA